MLTVSSSTRTLLEAGAALSGAALALLVFALLLWTWRDISARTKRRPVRLLALALVLLFNVIGLVVYLLLRPRETLVERREREMIEEILAREVTSLAHRQRAAQGAEAARS